MGKFPDTATEFHEPSVYACNPDSHKITKHYDKPQFYAVQSDLLLQNHLPGDGILSKV